MNAAQQQGVRDLYSLAEAYMYGKEILLHSINNIGWVKSIVNDLETYGSSSLAAMDLLDKLSKKYALVIQTITN